jgi:drug/metabolite transporter (DMT)-like permease
MTSPQQHARRAAGRLVLSSSLFAVMAVLAKVIARRIPGAEVAFVRFAAGVVVTVGLWAAGRVDIQPRRWRWLAARGFFGGTAVLAYFACIQLVPVGEATLLNQTQPVYTLLFAWALLGERPRRALLVALPLTLLGTALVVDLRHGAVPGRAAGNAAWGAALGVISAVASGVAVTSVRAARRRLDDGPPPETAWSVFFSFTTLGLVVTLPTVLPPLGSWVAPSPREWALLAGMGAAGVGGQVVMSEALQHLGGASAGVISQLAAVLTVAAGALLLGEPLTSSFVAGAVLTLAGVAVAVLATGSGRRGGRQGDETVAR